MTIGGGGKYVGLGDAAPGSYFGSIYISASAATALLVGTWTKFAGTTLAGTLSAEFDMPADNRLRYIGVPTKSFLVTAAVSIQLANNNRIMGIALGENGTAVAATRQDRFIRNATDEGCVTTQWIFSLATNDYVELFGDTTVGAGNGTLDHMIMSAHQL